MSPPKQRIPTGTSRRGELLVNLALAFGVSAGLLLVCEGTARFFERPEGRPRMADEWAPGAADDHFYTLKRRPLGWPPSEINADGLRDRAHSEARPEDVWRVAVLGDSVTEGFGLAAEQAFPRELERQLEADGERVEVLSLAVRGWSTRQQRIAYHRIARRYRPDQVLVATCLNDITELALQLRPPPPLLRALHRRSALVRRVVDAAHREQAQVEELFRGRPDLTAYFAELGRLRREVEEDGAELTVAVLPYRFQLEPGAPPASVQAEVTAWCAAESLRCLDLRPALVPLGPAAAFVDENHLSREGSAAVAAALRPLLPGRSMPEALGDALANAPMPASEAARRWLAASRPPLAPSERRLVREALVAALGAPGPRVRAGAAWALGSLLPEAGAETALRAALADRSDAVVATAARALRARGDSSATTAVLLRALSHPSPAVRWAAADALATREARPDWLPALGQALATPDGYLRNFAAFTVGRLGAPDESVARELARLLAEASDDEAPGFADALARLGPARDGALPGLFRALRSGEPAERASAARALGLLQAREAVPALARALRDDDPAVRARVALALAHIGEAGDALPALRAALRDADPWVREEAARALGLLAQPDPALTDGLLAALSDAAAGVRRHAARALARVGPEAPQVRAALARATADADERVRHEARQSLERLSKSAAPR
jgi:HEAT repeat protein/lysophospholipase L1-like esterase